ncbi:MAG: hypothetical protein PWQ88_599 [Candidatus Methanomethylophilaceae archaeon]|nr:hypothetical protein [Candidatus Methanomethylophilaceae archaeon]MDI3541566.1 hypothetical protein [Candidatus Methanomethylophilaceae archaeon]
MTCHGGALEVTDGKVRLVDSQLCDGLGDCTVECPQDALYLGSRDVAAYDEYEVSRRLASKVKGSIPVQGQNNGAMRMLRDGPLNWPFKLELAGDTLRLPGMMEMVIAGDCVGFIEPGPIDLVRDRALLICCPKMEDRGRMISSLENVLRYNDVRRITILRVDIPCCSRLRGIVKEALQTSKRDIPIECKTISV